MALCLEKKVEQFAFFSRISIIVLQFIFNILIPDYVEVEPDRFTPPKVPESITVWDGVVQFFFGGFRHWDAEYFLHISEHGYAYEKCLVFFPLFPWIVRGVANTLFYPLQLVLAYHNVLLLSALFVNFFVFIKAAKVLFRLGCKVLKDQTLAYKAALLFCINPANVCFSAPYSETLFAYFCFSGLLRLEMTSYLSSAHFLGLATLTRSNGLVTVFYIAYDAVKLAASSIQSLFRTGMTNMMAFFSVLTTIFVYSFVPLLLSFMLFIFPFASFHAYVYKLFCEQIHGKDPANYSIPHHVVKYGRDSGSEYKFVWEDPSPWCEDKIPISYLYIQSHIWNVGFLKYYTFNNIPNFCLALPIVILCCRAARDYYKRNKKYVLTLGLCERVREERRKKEDTGSYQAGFYSEQCFVYVVHMVALMVLGVTTIHVQILTRFLCSSCPIIYWYAATVITPGYEPGETTNEYDVMNRRKNLEPPVETEKNLERGLENLLTDQIIRFKENDQETKYVLGYFLSYSMIGLLMYVNSLPWL